MYYTNYKLIIYFILAILVSLIIRRILIYFLNKKDLEIAKEIVIGKEEIQEDHLCIVRKEYGTLAILGDGFGKNGAGRVSSNIAVNFIARMFEREDSTEKIAYFFKKAFMKANHEVIERIEKDKGGTSVTAAFIKNNLLYYALVGDVMLAIYRKGELVRISEGHNISEVAKNEYYKGNINKNEAMVTLKKEKLLHYIGEGTLDNIEMSDMPIRLCKGDIVILMNRGIYESIRWVTLEEILKDKSKDLDRKCEIIIEELDKEKNGSIILMKYCSK